MYKELEQPLQQQVGTQGLSLSSEHLLPDSVASLQTWCGGPVIYMHNKTPPECTWNPTFEQQ